MNATPFNTIIIHYGELALKGGNRKYFEQALIQSMEQHLKDLPYKRIRNLYGRIVIELKPPAELPRQPDNSGLESAITLEYQPAFERALKRVFGIANFSFARVCPKDISLISKTAVEILQILCQSILSRKVTAVTFRDRIKEENCDKTKKEKKSFKIETARSDKTFPLTSLEASKEVGAEVIKQLGLKVDVKNPDLTCYVEITHQGVFIMPGKIQGLGGLPTDTSGLMLGFLSGGIDSPVACFRMMNRGVRLTFVHFHSYPQTNKESINKVKELAKALNEYQLNSKLYLVPFLEIQKQILTECQAAVRVILYRRLMMRIGNEIACRENARAIVTGESLGQVASQTIENLAVIERAAKLPVLRPLIGTDKEEIINLAKKIDTYEISIRPHDDCCQIFLPEHPATKSRLEEVESEEKKLDMEKLVKEAVEKSEIIFIKTQEHLNTRTIR